jgi:DNA-binding response OmpR family regulator
MNDDVNWTDGGFAALCTAITGAAPSAAVTEQVAAWQAAQADRLQAIAAQWPRCAFQATLLVGGAADAPGSEGGVFKFTRLAGVPGWEASVVAQPTAAVRRDSADLATQLAGAILRFEPVADFRSDLLFVDELAGEVLVNGAPCQLTPTLFRLVCQLARRAGETCSPQELLHRVWGPQWNDLHLLKATIARLRGQLGPGAGLIENVRGDGYRLRAHGRVVLDYGPLKVNLARRAVIVDGRVRRVTTFELTFLTAVPPGTLQTLAALHEAWRPRARAGDAGIVRADEVALKTRISRLRAKLRPYDGCIVTVGAPVPGYRFDPPASPPDD